MQTQHFEVAPWSKLVRIATTFTLVLMVGIIAAGLFSGPRGLLVWQISMVWIPLAFIVVSPLFMIRGYTLDEKRVRVQRLGWYSTIDLREMQEVRYVPEAMKGAWRLCGNGGLFCLSGLFKNKELGNFRAFVTNSETTVVINAGGKNVVVSPKEPEAFVAALAQG
jgi:hypothetical protein